MIDLRRSPQDLEELGEAVNQLREPVPTVSVLREPRDLAANRN